MAVKPSAFSHARTGINKERMDSDFVGAGSGRCVWKFF